MKNGKNMGKGRMVDSIARHPRSGTGKTSSALSTRMGSPRDPQMQKGTMPAPTKLKGSNIKGLGQ